MISTVVSTVSTVSTVTRGGVSTATQLGLISTLVLIALLIVKELTGARVGNVGATETVTLSRAMDKAASVAIAPLLIVFGFIVIVQIIGVLH